jgi:protein TonB
MFEDSLFASGVTVEQQRSARRTRLLALISVGVQGMVLAGFIIVPMIWPERLPLVSVAPRMTALFLRKPEIKVEPRPVRVPVNDSAVRVPSAPQPMMESRGSTLIQHGPSTASAAEQGISLYVGNPMGGPPSLASVMNGDGSGHGPVVTSAANKPTSIPVSRGVMQGRLLAPILPVYPPIARAAHVQGTVVVTATIDKDGRIVGAQVLSGPEMLRRAAIDAIRLARYKPYLLNDQPTEVTTTISVNFTMGG